MYKKLYISIFSLIILSFISSPLVSNPPKPISKCTELIFWYEYSTGPLDDGFDQASMWYTPCGADREGPTKVFKHDGSNATTSIAEGSLVRIGVYHSDISKFKGNLSGKTAYVKCSFYDDNENGPYNEINTCTQSGPPPGSESHSSKSKK